MYQAFDHNTVIHPQQFLLQETGTYQEQEIRPFNTVINNDVVETLINKTHGGQHVGVSAVNNIAADIIRPSADTEGTVAIANGWRSRRFRFLMKVVESHPFDAGLTTIRLLSGCTDHCDCSYGQNLDPEMRIYFNSEVVITEQLVPTMHGMVKQAMVSGANQIISPVNHQDPNLTVFNRPVSHLIRPEDIYNLGETKQHVNMLNSTGQYDGGIGFQYDARTFVASGGVYMYSRRRDTSPTRYVADSLGGYQQAFKEQVMANQGVARGLVDSGEYSLAAGNQAMLYGDAANFTGNQDIQSNRFLARLKEHVGYMEKGYVTFKELCYVYPEFARIGDVTHYKLNSGQTIRKISQAEDSAHWHGADPVTIAASLVAQVIPAIMMENFIRTISFAVTNGNMPGTYRLEIHGHNTRAMVDHMDMVPYFQEFERRLAMDVLNSITHGNQLPFSISMQADLVGDSIIDIRLGSNPLTRYVAPTFIDSLFSPMITRSESVPDKVSRDMIWLAQRVIGLDPAATAQQPVYMPPSPQPIHMQPQQTSFKVTAEEFGSLI